MPPTGVFVGYDVMSTDPAATRAFYTALFGWSVVGASASDDLADGPARFENAGAPVAGLVPLDPTLGYPTHWLPYVATADVDATAGRVLGLGGQLLHPPTDLPGGGRFAVASDPAGGLFAPVRLAEETAIDRHADGAIAWSELLTADEGVRRFYAGVFGYAVVPLDLGRMGTYWLFEHDRREQAGLSCSDGALPACWLPYVRVADVDSSVTMAVSLGAKVCSAPMNLPKLGRFAVLEDPLGGVIGVIR